MVETENRIDSSSNLAELKILTYKCVVFQMWMSVKKLTGATRTV